MSKLRAGARRRTRVRVFFGFLALALPLPVMGATGPVDAGAATAALASAQPLDCGSFRWPVKTLSDQRASRVNYEPVSASVRYLRRRATPQSLSSTTPRLNGPERQTFVIQVRLVAARRMGDRDIHLIVAGPHHPGRQMIVEFPSVKCKGAAGSKHRDRMVHARQALLAKCPPIGQASFTHLSGRATITGVGFFDSPWFTPNGIELHPALGFTGECHVAAGAAMIEGSELLYGD